MKTQVKRTLAQLFVVAFIFVIGFVHSAINPQRSTAAPDPPYTTYIVQGGDDQIYPEPEVDTIIFPDPVGVGWLEGKEVTINTDSLRTAPITVIVNGNTILTNVNNNPSSGYTIEPNQTVGTINGGGDVWKLRLDDGGSGNPLHWEID